MQSLSTTFGRLEFTRSKYIGHFPGECRLMTCLRLANNLQGHVEFQLYVPMRTFGPHRDR